MQPLGLCGPRFAGLVEDLLDAGPRPYREEVEVKPRSASRTAAADSGTLFIPVRVINRGSHVIAAQGPGARFAALSHFQ